MQTTQNIRFAQLDRVLEAVFKDGNPIVKEAYSEFDSPTKTFLDVDALRTDMSFSPGQEKTFFYYAIYYPDTKGTVSERKINLNPGAVVGHSYRHTQEGWGLIFLQCDYRKFPIVKCRIAVNSPERASKWSGSSPEMSSPDSWDWKIVRRHAGRLVRLLRKLSKEVENDSDRPTAK
ncbi:hypothetical protein Pla144_51010 [Bythopirellula polymerisocia]|uniref:Uncharacterized protein n=1 Tax=Bythopirellula polymerisocia TaxID=2528003 RepID=A0A5C6C486_9BACT|nr:hypothetical protein Pla144_51010 [Bythopirellula polymerisocia]